MRITRRQLLVHATTTAAFLSDALNRHIPGWDAFAQTVDDWDRGAVFHVLPTVSHEHILLKLSLTEPQSGVPVVTVGARTIAGARTDSRGFFWEFDIADLAPARSYRLELGSERGRALAEPWSQCARAAAGLDERQLVRVVSGPDRRWEADASPKPYWQPGWLAQHDRLIDAMHGMRGRIPLIVSGDIHAIAVGTISRCGRVDLSSNPVVSVLPGPIGTDGTAWPRAVEHANQLDVTDRWTPIRENGFAVLDFYRERIDVSLFRWNGQQQSAADIPALKSFTQVVLPRR